MLKEDKKQVCVCTCICVQNTRQGDGVGWSGVGWAEWQGSRDPRSWSGRTSREAPGIPSGSNRAELVTQTQLSHTSHTGDPGQWAHAQPQACPALQWEGCLAQSGPALRLLPLGISAWQPGQRDAPLRGQTERHSGVETRRDKGGEEALV